MPSVDVTKMGSQHAARLAQMRSAACITCGRKLHQGEAGLQQWSKRTISPPSPSRVRTLRIFQSTGDHSWITAPLQERGTGQVGGQAEELDKSHELHPRDIADQVSVQCAVPERHVICQAASDSGCRIRQTFPSESRDTWCLQGILPVRPTTDDSWRL